MSRMVQLMKRVEKLERLIKPEDREPKGPPMGCDLLTPKEQELEDIIHMVHDVAVRLGYGTYSACRYHFNRGCSPWTNSEVFAKCMEAFTDGERRRYELSEEIVSKCIRLTAVLTDEEKALVKKCNKVARFFDSELLMNGAEKGWWPGHTREELRELKVLYGRLMVKYGERSYE